MFGVGISKGERGEDMNIAICDDVLVDAEKIRSYLLAYFEKNGFMGDIHLYACGETLLQDFARRRFDVLFLDIYLDGMSGVDVARHIRERDPNCLIVFITSSDSHMREGFALRVASYVEKPLTEEKVGIAFAQCRNLFMKNARYIEFKLDRRDFRLPFNRLVYAEGKGHSAFFYADTGEIYESHITMEDVERQLEGLPILRCHRSFVVNMNYVTDIHGNDIIMKGGQLVPIRKNGRREVVSALNEFLTGRLFEEVEG